MPRCGCAGACSCVVRADPNCPNVHVTGVGSPGNPYLVCVDVPDTELSEFVSFHHPHEVTLTLSDPRPIVIGGTLRAHVEFNLPPTTDMTMQVWKNGAPDGAPFVVTGPDIVDLLTVFVPGDNARLETTDLGTGGADGLVVVYELHP